MRSRAEAWGTGGALAVGLAAALVLGLGAAPFPAARLAPGDLEGHRLLDRHGRLLRHSLGPAGRATWRDLDQISPWAARALVAVEDHRFAQHRGVDLQSVARAARDNLRAGRVVAGGSTLTQQLVGLVAPHPRTLPGKLREALLALRLERAVDKDAILTQYLNRAPFGNGAVGIEAAARLYLGRSARALSLAEAALLCGIPQAPSRLNPFRDVQAAQARQRRVLGRMRALGIIDPAQHAEALAEPLRLVDRDAVFAAPHFTSWVLAQAPPPGTLTTTLDLDLQRDAEAAVRRTLAELDGRGVRQAAVVVLDTPTGDILAWVGSADFHDPQDGQVDMVTWPRQPGSALKPFLYGLALESGMTAADLLPDLPLYFPTPFGDYTPRNYDRRYHGWLRLRPALANSYNVPAVVLAERVGVRPLLARLRELGMETLSAPAHHYGLGLALGNGEVRLLDLANAYRALAKGGEHSAARWRRGPARARRVMPAAVAHLVTDMLADPVARAPAFGRGGALELPFPAAAKTGTSADFTDNWAVGYTPAVTVAAWAGNFDGRPMKGVSGVTGAGPLMNRVLRVADGGRGGPFSTEGLERRTVCRETGGPFGPGCAHALEEWFVAGAPRPPPPRVAPRLGVVFPDEGDVFGLDADTPTRFARLRLRASAPEGVRSLAWEVDGAVVATVGPPFEHWWSAAPGRHTVRVRAGARASDPVRFTVLR